jgi:hypothetical protein
MVRVILKDLPKISYEDAVLYHRFLCSVYPIKKLIKSFVENKLYEDATLGVEWVMREENVSKTRAFTIVGNEIGQSTSWVPL